MKKADRKLGRAAELTTRNNNGTIKSTSKPDTFNSDVSSGEPSISHRHDVNAERHVMKTRLSPSRRKKRSSLLYLQTLGLALAFIAIPLAYWQGTLQASHNQFERNQRVIDVTTDLATYWEDQLDIDTRYRVLRFLTKLDELGDDTEKRHLANSLIIRKNWKDAKTILENKPLSELIEPDISADTPENLRLTPVAAVSRYRTAIIKSLNTMEHIAIVRQYSEGLPELVELLSNTYVDTTQQQYKRLSIFIEEYHKHTNDGRKKPAWHPLTKMVEDMDRKSKEEQEKKN